jgi:hypothetical protein
MEKMLAWQLLHLVIHNQVFTANSTVSLPNLAITSSVTDMIGRLATTSFEAGGTLGGFPITPWQQ